MADLIKKIKIKKQDGTFTDYIPIGADASNVNVDGESVQYKLNKKPYYYNTVADMKADIKLKAGDMAITLGYYEPNDGGGAEYIIRKKTEEDIDDGGSVHIIGNLVAELIVEDGVNVKQFGAKGDGINDDTNYIQTAINFCKNKINVNTIYLSNCLIIIPTGRYIINDTIILPIFCKLQPIGQVLFLSNVENNSTLWINSGEKDMFINKLHCYYDGAYSQGGIINSSCGALVLQRNTPNNPLHDVNDLQSISVGIEVGDREQNNYQRVSRCIINNIAVHGFAKALKINAQNTYIIKFENLYLLRNRINVEYGSKGIELNNSGENFIFDKCIFGLGYTAFKINNIAEFNFLSCSFDFHGCVFDIESYQQPKINLFGGHIEGIGISSEQILTNKNNTDGYGCVCYNNTSYIYGLTRLNLYGTEFYLSENTDNSIIKFQSTQNIANRVHLSVALYGSNLSKEIETFNNAYLCNDNDTEIVHYDDQFQGGKPKYMTSSKDNIGRFENVPNSTTNVDNLKNQYMYEIQLPDGATLSSFNIDTTTKVFNKSLKINYTNANNIKLNRKIENPLNKKIKYLAYFKLDDITGDTDVYNNFQVRFTPYCYNSNDIKTKDFVNKDMEISDCVYDNATGWYRTTIFIDEVPTGTSYIKLGISIRFRNSNNSLILTSGSLHFGGVIVEFLD